MNNTTAPNRSEFKLGQIVVADISPDDKPRHVCGNIIRMDGFNIDIASAAGVKFTAPRWMVKEGYRTTNVPPTDLNVLFQYMRMGIPINLIDHNGISYKGTVTGIAREDGSGKCWNITLHYGSTIFIRYS